MENKNNIVANFTFMAFGKMKKTAKLQIADFVNSKSGDTFKSLVFTSTTGDKTFVAFSKKLGVLTKAELAAQKADLQVVEMAPDANGKVHYVLCKQGANTWEDVDIDFGF